MTAVIEELTSDNEQASDGPGSDERGGQPVSPAADAPQAPQIAPAGGETYQAVDVGLRTGRALLGSAALESVRTNRIMPRRLTFDRRAFGAAALVPIIRTERRTSK